MAVGQAAILLIVVVTLGISVEFLFTYHRRSHGAWRHDPAGRAIMLLAAGLALFMLSSILRIFERTFLGLSHPWLPVVVVGSFLLVPMSLVWFRMLMSKVMKRDE